MGRADLIASSPGRAWADVLGLLRLMGISTTSCFANAHSSAWRQMKHASAAQPARWPRSVAFIPVVRSVHELAL